MTNNKTVLFFNTALNEVAKQLALFLEGVLPSLFEDWWKQAVLNSLSFQQRRRIEQSGLNALGALDLAALLRVLDQNWYQISGINRDRYLFSIDMPFPTHL